MNTQKIEKSVDSDGSELDIHSMFFTIQGEGPYSGQRALFIRLAGCNLQCPGCDTDYTSKRQTVTITHALRLIRQVGVPPFLVVITGGEPFRQNISKLTNALVILGYTVQVETNGTLPPSKNLHKNVKIVCSPKTGSVHPEIMKRANCFKYVIHSDSVHAEDGLPILALDHSAKPKVARPRAGAEVYIQPMDCENETQNARNMEAARQSCMTFGHTLQLQIHKIIGVE